MDIRCQESLRYLEDDHLISKNQKKTQAVVYLTAFTMVGEVIAGYMTHSMALTAEGWHMASHAGAMFIALMAYKLARSQKLNHRFSFGAGKLIPLGGYTSAVILAIVAILIAVESVTRLFKPELIEFGPAIGVACVGLAVNILSAFILRHEPHVHHHGAHSHDDHDHEHDHEHEHEQGKLVHDHNIRSAFLHVLADAVTSVLAIGALVLGDIYGIKFLDPIVGIVGALVILSWAFQLCRDTGLELLDGHSKTVNWPKLKSAVENQGARILDFHVWRIAPKAIACELVVSSPDPKGVEFYRSLLRDEFKVQHIIVEERPC